MGIEVTSYRERRAKLIERAKVARCAQRDALEEMRNVEDEFQDFEEEMLDTLGDLAEEAFWAKVVELTGSTTGDMDPPDVARFRAAIDAAVKSWCSANLEEFPDEFYAVR